VDVASGTEARQTGSFSWFNAKEAVQVLSFCKKVIKAGLSQSDVGIISPYRQQVVEIRKILKLSKLSDIRVGSTEEFQGTEYKCIIVRFENKGEKVR
jgi:superfamily I DNA and/or RNA helicase